MFVFLYSGFKKILRSAYFGIGLELGTVPMLVLCSRWAHVLAMQGLDQLPVCLCWWLSCG